jgi:hypothetical protein
MTIHNVLNERKKTHGEYADHARVTQALKAIMESEPDWHNLPPIMRETLAMIAHKIARILVGNPYHADHWQDICGYAQLVVDRIPQQELFRPGTPEDGGHHARFTE